MTEPEALARLLDLGMSEDRARRTLATALAGVADRDEADRVCRAVVQGAEGVLEGTVAEAGGAPCK